VNNTDLVSLVKAHRKDSLGGEGGELASERADAMDHYQGRLYGNEQEGRSAVVSRDLAEAVDWALPAIMRLFTHTGQIVVFDPVGPEDEEQAEQESDYVNQILMKDNNGFMLLHDVFKDAMILKNGYAKHYWEVSEKVEEEDYTGMTMEGVQKLFDDIEAKGGEYTIKGAEVREVPIPGMPEGNEAMQIMVPQTMELVDMKLQVKTKCGKLCVLAVPAEEVRVSKRCRGSLQESPFTEHVTRKTRSVLVEMGIPQDWVYDLPAYSGEDKDGERLARDSVTDESTGETGSSFNDRSMDEIEYCEAYVRVDYDKDGVAELRKVVTCADRVPPGEQWNEAIESVPMTSFVMKRVPHRHVGQSLDDELSDLQETKTMLHRQVNDNVYRTNNVRTAANELVNLKDLMSSTPGGVVRVKGMNAPGASIMELPVTPILNHLMPVIDYWDKVKEIRTGIRPGSDLDPETLQDVTKGAFMEHMNRASQKVEMIARLLADGVREMVLQCHGILIRHQDIARKVQIRGEWTDVNPREWKRRTDLSVRVGIGTGNEEEKRQKLSMLAQFQGQLMQAATGAPPPVYAKMYSLFEDLSKALGFEVPERYALSPEGPEYAQLQQQIQQSKGGPPPEVQIEQMKIEATGKVKMQEMQHKGEIAQMQMMQDAQLEKIKAQYQAMVDQNRQQVEAQQQQARMSMEQELEQFKARLKMSLESEAASMKQQTAIAIARINAESKLDAAQITAQTTLTAQQESASDGAVDA
jgi:hypothetical protein